jgi:hypothetical protein
MSNNRFLLRYAVLLLALAAANPTSQGANRKTRPTQKPNTAKSTQATQQEDFQKTVGQQIASLKEDVYTRATWKKLQEVKQEADDTAGTVRLVTLGGVGIGFVLGCVVTVLVSKRTGRSDENLKIT